MQEPNIGDILVSKSSLDGAYSPIEEGDINLVIILGYK